MLPLTENCGSKHPIPTEQFQVTGQRNLGITKIMKQACNHTGKNPGKDREIIALTGPGKRLFAWNIMKQKLPDNHLKNEHQYKITKQFTNRQAI